MDYANLKKNWKNLNETNLIDYLNGIRDCFLHSEPIRDFSTNLHKLRQHFLVVNKTHPNKLQALQFIISKESGKDTIDFWLEFKLHKDVFDIFLGINPKPLLIIRITDFQTVLELLYGTVWKIQALLDENDPKISLEIENNSNFELKKICSKMILDYSGMLGDCARYLWSDPR
ncbi:MAG: hypothetical protein EU530_08280 [Promethearchaeota archaeon]|nr:MAG: hypothetical protein EU530_08280 [Candidatus Lokiarchaeota archaeon]